MANDFFSNLNHSSRIGIVSFVDDCVPLSLTSRQNYDNMGEDLRRSQSPIAHLFTRKYFAAGADPGDSFTLDADRLQVYQGEEEDLYREWLDFFKKSLIAGDYSVLSSPTFIDFPFAEGDLFTLFREVIEERVEKRTIIKDLDVLPSRLTKEECLQLTRVKIRKVIEVLSERRQFNPPLAEEWSDYLEQFIHHSVDAKAIMIEELLSYFSQLMSQSEPKLLQALTKVVDNVKAIQNLPIDQANQNYMQTRMLDWLMMVELSCSCYQGDNTELACLLPLIGEIRNPDLRYHLTRNWQTVDNAFFNQMSSEQAVKRFENKFPIMKLLRMQLAYFSTRFLQKEDSQTTLQAFLLKVAQLKNSKSKKPLFWNIHRLNHLLKVLVVLGKSSFLNPNQKLAIIEKLTHQLTEKNAQDVLFQLDFLLARKSPMLKSNFNEFIDIVDPELKKIFSQAGFVIQLSKGKSYFDYLKKKFGKLTPENPLAVLLYLASLVKLKTDEFEIPKSHLFIDRFIVPVLNKQFHQRRYDPTSSPQLSALLKLDPDFISKWSPEGGSQFEDLSMYLDPQYPAPAAGFQIGISDLPSDLLACGYKVKSCLEVDGDPEKNRGLLGYILHPQTAMVMIKDNEGMRARAVLRAMMNADQSEIILFLEPAYTEGVSHGWECALRNFVHQKADQWGYRIEMNGIEGLKETLISLPSIADEYYDSFPSDSELKVADAGTLVRIKPE